jgi:UPF0755 protein
MRRALIAFIILLLLAVAAFFAEQWSFFAPGPQALHGRSTIVWIEPGMRSAAIAQALQNARVIHNAALFRLGVQLRRKNTALKAGEYAIPSSSSMADIMGILAGGKSIQHKLTIAEGLTSQMIYDVVRKDPLLTGDAGTLPPEGTLLPETYYYMRGTPRPAILARMTRAQARLLAKLWPARKPNLPFQSPEQAVTLASIVEKETALPEERRHIAAVFINRLRAGMKLQSDPTIIYGITKGYPLGRRIRESEIAAATPYNTYVIAGLPPAPICNPGKDSLEAVLQPEDSQDLYFVANGTGGHVFTASIAEHEKNVAKWRAIEQSREQPGTVGAAASASNLSLRGSADTVQPPPPKEAPRAHRHRHWKRRG